MICAIVVADSLLATVLFPFIYSMVHGFEGVKEQHVGFWAGVISMHARGVSGDERANIKKSIRFLLLANLDSHSLGSCI